MSEDTPSPKMGRPPKQFDPKVFEGLCQIGCTQKEILSIFRTTDKTLSGWIEEHYGQTYSEVYDEFFDSGNMSIRRTIYAKGIHEKDNYCLGLLAKNRIGYADKQEITHKIDPFSKMTDEELAEFIAKKEAEKK